MSAADSEHVVTILSGAWTASRSRSSCRRRDEGWSVEVGTDAAVLTRLAFADLFIWTPMNDRMPHAGAMFFADRSRILAFCASVDMIAIMAIKHATASVFLFAPTVNGWQLGFIRHPRFRRWMLPGGHVEPDENPAETARREVEEETGLRAELLTRPRFAAPGRIHQEIVAPPLWIVEERVPPEPRLPSDHVHIDFLYAAMTRESTPPVAGELRLGWFAPHQLDGLGLFEETLLLAHELYARLPELMEGNNAASG